jgi:LmbE family N-acetylglucosaminyl deacetylase
MTDTTRRVAMAVMAHPDDAEFLCAGTLIRLADAGWEIHIATLAPGDCGTMTETSWEISGRRTEEAKASAAVIGATYHCLDERDGFIVYEKTAIRKTLDLFRLVTPSLVFTHPPSDYMLDHEETSKLARAASFLYGAPNASSVPLHKDACVPHLYYCDSVEGIDPISGEPIEPTTWIDVTAQMERKTQMLCCHASQREWLRAHHGMDEYVEAMRRHATMRGETIKTDAAETFILHRGHPYPQNDILADLLGQNADKTPDKENNLDWA